jgi:CheY-like chemotaxis protein
MIDQMTVFLVVDDFEPMRKVTSSQLRSMGAKVILTAKNGAEALRLLNSKRIDIVLSDWNMPVMSGLDLLKAMRADPGLAHVPFVMITAEAERDRIEEAIACGVSDLLVKPYTFDRLCLRVKNALINRARIFSLIPVTAAATATAENTENKKNISLRQTILVVDDTADNLLLISQIFKEKYRVRIAHTGAKALNICQSNTPPDLVLLDIMMPVMDGFEVARKMREHPTSAAIPVIFVTAMTGEEALLKGLNHGAIDFVSKPINPDVLKLRVENFMRYVELNKQLQANYDDMLELARLQENVEQITRHDIKGAMAGVIGLVQLLAKDDLMNVRQLGQLHMAEETALQVVDMINLSSELFKIETGHFELDAQSINIVFILRRIVEISRAAFAEKHLVVTIDTDMPVGEEVPNSWGDEMLCYSLFQNLIKNACEAAPDKGRVTVKLFNDTPLRIVIENRGVVPAEIRGRFFEKFVTHGKQDGTGLGTYSAKLLTEAQNGIISLRVSDLENQTTITVILPRYTEPVAST